MTYAQTHYALTPAELSEIDAERASERAIGADLRAIRDLDALIAGGRDIDCDPDVCMTAVQAVKDDCDAGVLMRLVFGPIANAKDAPEILAMRVRVRAAVRKGAGLKERGLLEVAATHTASLPMVSLAISREAARS